MTKVDDDLQAFLEWNAAQRSAGFTIANVLVAQNNFATALRHLSGRVAQHDSDFEEVNGRLDEHGAAIVTIKRRLRQDSADDEMDTGNFDVQAVKRELAEARQKRIESERVKAEEQIWWKRSVIMWVVGGLGFVAATALTVLVTLAIVGATTPKAMPPAAQAPK